MASDAHSDQYRTPHMDQLRRALEDRCGSAYCNILLRINPDRIAHDRPLLAPDEP